MLNGAGVPPCASLARRIGRTRGDQGRPGHAGAGTWPRGWSPRPGSSTGTWPRRTRSDKESEALAREALAALRALPADEQRARVAALRDAERTCAEGDRLEMLTGTSTAR